MKYDITKPQPPKMPELKKGSECIKKLLSKGSKGIQEPILPMLFPILVTYVSNGQLRNSDLSGWKRMV